MNYEEGLVFIKDLYNIHNANKNKSKTLLTIEQITIESPGYKKNGDYRVLYNSNVFTHFQIVSFIYKHTTLSNATEIIDFLEDVFINGLNEVNSNIYFNARRLIFWLTLQEDLNYPMPRYQGRKLTFQRYYEGILAKLEVCRLDKVKVRTNNHYGGVPRLIKVPENIKKPIFYDLEFNF